MANVDHISTQGFNPVPAIANFFGGLAESFRLSRRFQATFNELDSLANRDLADLGISRSDITRIAYDAVYGTDTSEFKGR